MPQATDQLRDRMNDLFGDPVDDGGPIAFLEKCGFRLLRSWEWRPPEGIKDWDDLNDDEKDCISFLCDEWDFGGIDFNANL